MVVAMGIDVTGEKHIMGVVEGSTESEQVGRRLFQGPKLVAALEVEVKKLGLDNVEQVA